MPDDTQSLLKEEIHKTMESQHDLAKWKLILISALGGAALGLSRSQNSQDPDDNYWLLLFIPFVCAYVDLDYYQYQIRIITIGTFLGKYAEGLQKAYENRCAELRKQHVFSLGNWANIWCSVVASGLAGWLFCQRQLAQNPQGGGAGLAVWAGGFLLVILLNAFFQVFQARAARMKGRENQWPKA